MQKDALNPEHLKALAKADTRLAPLTEAFAHLSYRRRPGGFKALLRLIIEQQLSVKAADTILLRLQAGVGDLSPERLLAHDGELMRSYGLSRPKISYARALAEAFHTGQFDAGDLQNLEIEEATRRLTALRGIGTWTAEVYLMFCEGRPDLFPVGDIALREAVGWLDRCDSRPNEAYCAERAQDWAPYRSIAAQLLWAWYGAVKRGDMSRDLTLKT